MHTATVTPIRPAFTHSDSCDAVAIGCNVLNMIAAGETVLYFDELAAIVDANPRPRCDCGQRALRNVNEELRLARKALRAIPAASLPSSATARLAEQRIAELTAQRDAIRAAI